MCIAELTDIIPSAGCNGWSLHWPGLSYDLFGQAWNSKTYGELTLTGALYIGASQH